MPSCTARVLRTFFTGGLLIAPTWRFYSYVEIKAPVVPTVFEINPLT